MAQRQSHQRAPKQALRALDEAARKVRVFTEPNNPKCGVSAEAREEARLYVETWIGGPLEAALAYLRGQTSQVDWTCDWDSHS